MIDQLLVAGAARRLRDAYRTPTAPRRDVLAPTAAAGAYAVEAGAMRAWRDKRRCVPGSEVGLSAKAVQARRGVDRPGFGIVFADMEIQHGGMGGQEDMIVDVARVLVAARGE